MMTAKEAVRQTLGNQDSIIARAIATAIDSGKHVCILPFVISDVAATELLANGFTIRHDSDGDTKVSW